jgi:hypothetical protein
MPEKLADDYGLTKLLAYLKAHCYKTGDGGSFQLATNDDIDNLVLTDVDEHDGPTWHEDTQSDTFDNTQAQFTWSDKRSVTKAIKRFHDLAVLGDQVHSEYAILDSAHVPNTSIIAEYFYNTCPNYQAPFGYWQEDAVKGWVRSLKKIYGNTIDEIKKNKLADIKQKFNKYYDLYNAHVLAGEMTNTDLLFLSYMGTEDRWDGGITYVVWDTSNHTMTSLLDDDKILAKIPNGTELVPGIPYSEYLEKMYGGIPKAIEHYIAEV